MNTPTFKEGFDKITTAYIHDKLDPYNGCACFIGNLLNNKPNWEYIRNPESTKGNGHLYCSEDNSIVQEAEMFIKIESNRFYTPQNILDMENNFLRILWEHMPQDASPTPSLVTEESLFEAMESTLDMLKQIHISKGEDVEEYQFTKRQLETV